MSGITVGDGTNYISKINGGLGPFINMHAGNSVYWVGSGSRHLIISRFKRGSVMTERCLFGIEEFKFGVNFVLKNN